ncbi:hypothetical protein lerEdw1_009158 [Lerista edwardsae]|nr:hypothetical protein lerEdw1_009158 [Lerista edwardsae]
MSRDLGIFFPNDTDLVCEPSVETDDFLHFSLAPAVFIIVVLSCLERRTRRWYLDKKLHKLSGCGGFVIPFDFIRAYDNRWSFGFAFGATVDKLMFLFNKGYDDSISMSIPGWAKVFWVLLIATEVGLSSYPFFACLSTSHRIIGSMLGFLYSAAWLTISAVDIAQCPQGRLVGEYGEVIMYWPSLLCQFALLLRFLYGFVKALRAQCVLDSGHEEAPFLEEHQAQYVQQLLKKPLLQQPQKSWIKRKIYEWDPFFRFPSRMIIMAVIAINALYAFIMLEYIASNYMILRPIRYVVSTFTPVLRYQNLTQEETDIIDSIEEFVDVAKGVWIATIVISALTCSSYVFRIFAFYRTHMRLLQRGKRYLLLSEDIMISPSHSLVALGRYISWQIAYILWGYLIIHLVQFVAGMVFVYLVILPMKHGQWMQLLNKWGTVFLSLAIIMAIKQLQIFVADRLFLQPKILPNDKHKPLALDNWKAYQIFTYFLFFFTVVVGLTSCLMRLLRSLALGAWLIGRLDRTVMPKGFEGYDSGFKTWVGMLLTDHYHTNPILVCFCHILITKTGEREVSSDTCAIRPTTFTRVMKKVPRVSERARTRWLLLYTLLNNPDLRKLRKPTPTSESMDSPNKYAILFA